MRKTSEGKWVVFDASTGEQMERWPIDAQLALKNGEITLEAPEGVTVSEPVAPPRAVGVPVVQPAKVFEAGDDQKKKKP